MGWGCTILAGTFIGDNVIIGADSVVTGKVDSNSVYAGNPARCIMSMEEYLYKRKKNQLREAVDFVIKYEDAYGVKPNSNRMGHYAKIFDPETESQKIEYHEETVCIPFENIEAFYVFCDEVGFR